MKRVKKLWLGLFILLLLSPLGLILPVTLNAGTPWGEWKAEELQKSLGYVPVGISRSSGQWSAPLPDYSFKGKEKAPLHAQGLSYLVSGLAGTLIVTLSIMLIGRICSRHEDIDNP
jgi:cobalt/nickel transport protein